MRNSKNHQIDTRNSKNHQIDMKKLKNHQIDMRNLRNLARKKKKRKDLRENMLPLFLRLPVPREKKEDSLLPPTALLILNPLLLSLPLTFPVPEEKIQSVRLLKMRTHHLQLQKLNKSE